MRAITLALIVAFGASVACRSAGGGETAPVLLFTGTGTSPGDVVAVRRILDDSGLAYATATSAQLDAMDAARLRAHRLLIVPGGNFLEIGDGLTPRATAAVREAIHGGVHYLGLCAGAFIAGDRRGRRRPRLGGAQRRTPGSSGELARRHDVPDTGRRRQRLRRHAHSRRTRSDPAGTPVREVTT